MNRNCGVLSMEIYNNENNKTEKYVNNEKQRSFFPRSELNDWLPLWEKLAFFLTGFLGIKLLSLIVSFIISTTNLYNTNEVLATVLINFFTYILLVLAFCGFLFFDRRKTYVKFASDFKKLDAYVWALIGFGLVLGYQLIMGNIFSAAFSFYGNNNNEQGIETMTKSYPIMVFILTVFFAPFVEELTYRVGLVDLIGHKYKLRWLGIIVSAVIFGCIHADIIGCYSQLLQISAKETSTAEQIQKATEALYNEWLNLPIYIGSGFILGLTYSKSGKISSSMLAHFGVNLFSMVVTFISQAAK